MIRVIPKIAIVNNLQEQLDIYRGCYTVTFNIIYVNYGYSLVHFVGVIWHSMQKNDACDDGLNIKSTSSNNLKKIRTPRRRIEPGTSGM